MDMPLPRLTDLAHGGGCGCKLAPSVLRQMLSTQPAAAAYAGLLVGTETGDDAAVWKINETTAIVATTDFFTPVVDDPYDFGRIAATNAISDVYAMAGRPIMALAIVGMPIDKLPIDTIQKILEGGASVCADAGIPVAGGHSIDSAEPIYGLVVIGTCHPRHVRRNSGAREGDALVLTKALGVGVYSAALKRRLLSDAGYAEFLASTTLLNRLGAELAGDPNVHAVTDVTGFGLAGHALEVARGSGLTLRIRLADVPLLSQAEAFAKAGVVTGASGRNWKSYGESVSLPEGMPDWQRNLLTDPQTSGGLLIACAPECAVEIVRMAGEAGSAAAKVIGVAEAGEPKVCVDG